MTLDYILRAAKASAKLRETESRIEDIRIAQVSYQSLLPDPSDESHAFGDWNDTRHYDRNVPYELQETDNTMGRLCRILEDRGIETEWYDEWTDCSDCGRMFRTSPDCYNWRMFGEIQDGEAICGHCIDPDEYLESRLDNPRSAVNTDIVDPTDHGFRNLNGDFENGFHPGQDDNPEEVLAEYSAQYPGYEFVFDYEPSQFYVTFRIFGRPKAEAVAA